MAITEEFKYIDPDIVFDQLDKDREDGLDFTDLELRAICGSIYAMETEDDETMGVRE